ncbi:MAG: aminopeptidase [Candidatus Micrarchaeia archaeon]|jgi:leucyl aminopeptidase (aminopeptidase T)
MDMKESARHMLKDSMQVKAGESVLIITDDEMPSSIPESLFDAALEENAVAIILKMKAGKVPSEEPPKAVADAMLGFDVIIAPTTKSISHTQARRAATEKGARIATLPGITERMMTTGGITADYNKVAESADKLQGMLNKTKVIRVVSKKGTDITFKVNPSKWHADTGICAKGDFINLPGGEIFIAPDDANGTYVVDGSMGDFGILGEPIKVEVKNRYATSITGGRADELAAMLDAKGKPGRNIAELGIGLNYNSKLIGNTLEDEKVKGTVHVALGDNSTFGGDVKAGIHIDGIIKDVEVYLDGKRIELENFDFVD